MKKIYSNVRGTSDFDGSRVLEFNQVNKKAEEMCKLFGYEEIILPMLEEKDLFTKSVGDTTDIVERQIFKIEGKDIVLRPEGTAQVVRYYLANSLHKKSNFHKFFYKGAMFRGERPQKGRLRQFHHLGVEAIGSDSPYLDAEVISLALKILDEVGVRNKELKINTLGCLADKVKFSKQLKVNLSQKKSDLCEDCRRRLDKNPLRVIDCKNKGCKNIVNSLNLGQEHLCDDCKSKFSDLLLLLTDLGIKYTSNPYLVRGLDYYTNTVFEITASGLGSQDAIGAGGRYNNLVKFLGGSDTPAIGFALGLERILLSLGESNKKQEPDYFIAVADKSLINEGFSFLSKLREREISADFDYCDKSLKAQLRFAQKKGAKYVVILNSTGKKTEYFLRNMQESTQEEIKLEELLGEIKTRR